VSYKITIYKGEKNGGKVGGGIGGSALDKIKYENIFFSDEA
jgi:hypothetical protein